MCKNNCRECVLKRNMKEVNKNKAQNKKAIKVYNGKCPNKLFSHKCYLIMSTTEYNLMKGGER